MSSPTILEQLDSRYDEIVAAIYAAGSGRGDWLEPLAAIAEIFQAWTVQLLGVNKKSGVMSFSFEAGSAPPEAPVEYLRYYHRIDPRLGKHLPSLPGEWFSCEEHFDEQFVAGDPFYQDYLIPFGARYLFGGKLHDDANSAILIGHLSRVGNPPLSPDEKDAFRKLADHFGKALDIQSLLADSEQQKSVALDLLEKLRQPIVLLDGQRRITYRNAAGKALLERGDLVREIGGQLACTDADADLALTVAIRDLALVPNSGHGDQTLVTDRRSLRLRSPKGRNAAATLLALRPEGTLGSFGRIPQALFTVFEPGASIDIDPFLLSTTFDLTPAEARLAARLVNGQSPEDCAASLGTKISTVRSQLISIYGKTGTSGQSELIRLILSAGTF